MFGDGNTCHDVGVGPELLNATGHVFGGHHQSFTSRIIHRPPFPAFALLGVSGIMTIGGDGLESEVIEMRLQSPEIIPRDVGVLSHCVEHVLEIGCRLPIRAVPAELINDKHPAVRSYSGRIARERGRRGGRLVRAKEQIPVRVFLKTDQIRAGIVENLGVAAKYASRVEIEMVRVELLDVGANGFRPSRDLGEVPMGENRKEAAHIAVLPGHYRRVIPVPDPGNSVTVIEDGVDMALIGGDDYRVGEEGLQIGLTVPGEILADTAGDAGGAVPYQGDDEAHVVFGGYGDGVVRRLKGGFVDLALFRFDTQRTTDGVAYRLGTNDLCTHLRSGVKGVIDLEAGGVARASGIVWSIGFQTKPLDVRAAIAKGTAIQGEMSSASFDEGLGL